MTSSKSSPWLERSKINLEEVAFRPHQAASLHVRAMQSVLESTIEAFSRNAKESIPTTILLFFSMSINQK